MVSKTKRTSGKEEKKGRVKVSKLKASRELSASDAKKVRGGRANFSDFSFVHNTDKASPVLFQSDPPPKTAK